MTDRSNAPRRRRSAIPLGLLGMLLLVANVESWVRRHDYALLKVDDWDWRLAGEASTRQAARADLLCFGDSLIKAGVAPGILESRTGLRAYNLAVGGGQAPTAYFLLRRVLESGGHPRALIVEFFPRLLELKPRHNIDHWPHAVGLRECLELGLATGDGEFLGSMLLARMFHSLRSRHEIRAVILASLEGPGNAHAKPGFPMVQVFRRSRGAFPFLGRGRDEFNIDAWIAEYFQFGPQDPVNVDYLHRFFDLADSHEIPVVWLIPPLMPELLAACERSGFDASLSSFVGEIQRRYPNVTVLDARRSGFDSTVFHDPHHLEYRGAYALSNAVADLIANDPPRPGEPGRWIELPRIAEPPARVALEDLQALGPRR